jgi:GDPmannose 4,6-dehydratase
VARRRKKRALVLGCNGQDGSYLIEHLTRRDYEVSGISRQNDLKYAVESKSIRYISLDLRQPQSLAKALVDIAPDTIFHMAAVHGEAGSKYESIWQDMLAVNVGATHICLEYLRNLHRGGYLVYAGSGKTFGPDYPRKVTERSRQRATSLYSVTKIAARDLIECYRHDHGIAASVLHLFNHESERRNAAFFLPTLISALHRSIKDRSFRATLNTLEFYCDWGSAREYMDLAVDIAERAPNEDMIVATGHTWKASALAERLFRHYDLDYRKHLIERGPAKESDRYFGVSNAKLRRLIGRVPQVGALALSEEMLATLMRQG